MSSQSSYFLNISNLAAAYHGWNPPRWSTSMGPSLKGRCCCDRQTEFGHFKVTSIQVFKKAEFHSLCGKCIFSHLWSNWHRKIIWSPEWKFLPSTDRRTRCRQLEPGFPGDIDSDDCCVMLLEATNLICTFLKRGTGNSCEFCKFVQFHWWYFAYLITH